MRNYVQKVWQVAACLLAIAIVVLSLVPPSHRPITDASHNAEHFAIFWAPALPLDMVILVGRLCSRSH